MDLTVSLGAGSLLIINIKGKIIFVPDYWPNNFIFGIQKSWVGNFSNQPVISYNVSTFVGQSLVFDLVINILK